MDTTIDSDEIDNTGQIDNKFDPNAINTIDDPDKV